MNVVKIRAYESERKLINESRIGEEKQEDILKRLLKGVKK